VVGSRQNLANHNKISIINFQIQNGAKRHKKLAMCINWRQSIVDDDDKNIRFKN
jgi:hypothetical protein